MPTPSTGYDLATVSNPDSALTDFTLVVDLSTMSEDWWDEVDTSDGTKGRAYAVDGDDENESELACDWVGFDNTGETGLLHVKWAGSLASSGTQKLRVYPPVSGNDSVAHDGTYGQDNAYDANWGFNSPDMDDDRVAGATATGTGSVSIGGGTGPIWKATAFDGTDDGIGYGTDGNIEGTGDYTVSMWVKGNGSQTSSIAEQRNGDYRGTWQWKVDSLEPRWGCYAGHGGQSSAWDPTVSPLWGATTSVVDNAWHHVVVVNASGTLTGFFDSVEKTSDTDTTGTDLNENVSFCAGYDQRQSDDHFTGSLAQFQIHNAARVADWIEHDYAQTNDNATFWGTWTWQTGEAPVAVAPTGNLAGPLAGPFAGVL